MINAVSPERDQAEIRRSAIEASITDLQHLVASPNNVTRYMDPPADTYPLDTRFTFSATYAARRFPNTAAAMGPTRCSWRAAEPG